MKRLPEIQQLGISQITKMFLLAYFPPGKKS